MKTLSSWLVEAILPHLLDGPTKRQEFSVVPSRVGSRCQLARSLDVKDYVRFHSFTPQEDRCVWLLVKDLGRGKPESVVLEELESLNIRVQGVTQLRSGRRD